MLFPDFMFRVTGVFSDTVERQGILVTPQGAQNHNSILEAKL